MSKLLMLIKAIKQKLSRSETKAPETDTGVSAAEVRGERAPDGPGGQPAGLEPQVTQAPAPPKDARVQLGEASNRTAQFSNKRDPYFIQLGFDYGTSFSKCVCRDIITDKAWVHIPPEFTGRKLPFLIPSCFLCTQGKLCQVEERDVQYPEGGLYHLKPALVKVALGQFDDPVLRPYRRACNPSSDDHLCGFVESCAAYFLGRELGMVREQVRQRIPDFGNHPKDYMAVNLAVPVADAQQLSVEEIYRRVLCDAWAIADELSGHPSIDLSELESLRRKHRGLNDKSLRDACYIYPEVSANVQGFVRSRVSSPGIYLFSDTGAATVDQSVFIFFRRADKTEHLTYLHGNVLQCGSSRIEFHAAEINGGLEPGKLEMWRERKERAGADWELTMARNMLEKPLKQGTRITLACTKTKLYIKENMEEIRLIFGGGGHSEHPYKTSVASPFSGDLFLRDVSPDIVGLPPASDLELESSQTHWMSRLAVAYGLSFYKGDLAGFTYPKDVEPPDPDQLWPTRRHLPESISKDQC